MNRTVGLALYVWCIIGLAVFALAGVGLLVLTPIALWNHDGPFAVAAFVIGVGVLVVCGHWWLTVGTWEVVNQRQRGHSEGYWEGFRTGVDNLAYQSRRAMIDARHETEIQRGNGYLDAATVSLNSNAGPTPIEPYPPAAVSLARFALHAASDGLDKALIAVRLEIPE